MKRLEDLRAAIENGDLNDGVVVLDYFRPGDVPTMTDADRDSEMRKRFEFPDDFVPSPKHSLSVIARWERERQAGERYTYAVRDIESGALLGGCELRPAGASTANLSYWTYPAHRRRSVASRAVKLITRVAFEWLSLEKLEVLTDVDNHGSRRVAQRGGFVEVGFRDERILHVMRKIGHGHRGA